VEYADRSGFNAALTLRSYLHEDEGITPRLTLQRVFLQLGHNARSFFHDELRVCTPEQNARMSCCCDRVVDRVSSLHASFALDSDASSNTRISVPLERHHLFLQPRVSVVSNDEETCLEEQEMSSSSHSAISMSESCEESTDYTEEHVVIGDVPRLDMETTSMTPEDIVSQGLPYILHFSSVSKWSAFTKWQDLNYLRQALEKNLTTTFRVKSGNGKGRDGTSYTKNESPWLHDVPCPFEETNMTSETLLNRLHDAATTTSSSHFLQAFSELPNTIKADVSPSRELYGRVADREKSMRFLWISTPGTSTHFHFDQDHNFFAQIVGRKRFTLIPASRFRDMHLFPRLHPLWHKSQVHKRCPNLKRLSKFADYESVNALRAVLEPGDVLYVPALTFHNVETLSDGLTWSVSTWTHNMTLYHTMQAIYEINVMPDKLKSLEGRVFALRLFLDVLLYEIVGNDVSSKYISDMITSRYETLNQKMGENEEPIWKKYIRKNRTPMSQAVYQDVDMDVRIVGKLFRKLSSVARDILLQDYVEEVVEDTIGMENVVSFFRTCFRTGMGYYLTDRESEDHRVLWEYE